MTQISISNIAWDTTDDVLVSGILASLDVHHIDIAPGKYFPNPEEASDADIAAVRMSWEERGFALAGFQSLLFGTQGLNVFGSEEVQERMLERLCHICRIAAGLGAKRLVFGSPKNRDRKGLSDARTLDMALEFFTRLGEMAQWFGVVVCLEPNPEAYGANFLTNTMDARDFVSMLDHPGIRLQLDTGAMFMNNESPEIIEEVRDWIGHVHISEPQLASLGESGVSHAQIGEAFKKVMGQTTDIVTIEMLIPKKDGADRGTLIERAIVQAVKLVRSNYL